MAARTTFDRQLDELRVHVQQLSQMVAASIDNSISALKEHDLSLAARVDQADSKINLFRFQIEEEAYTLLALQQPVSHDMRFIVSTISVVTNLERIGDYAAGIARLVLRMGENYNAVPLPEFDQMGVILQDMLAHSIQAYVNQDQPGARAVITRDAEVDRLHKLIYQTLITRMTHNTSDIENGTFALWISHNLERIGDRCANICERVDYLVTGELVHDHQPV